MISFFTPEVRNVCTAPFSSRNSPRPFWPVLKKTCPFSKSCASPRSSISRRKVDGSPLNTSGGRTGAIRFFSLRVEASLTVRLPFRYSQISTCQKCKPGYTHCPQPACYHFIQWSAARVFWSSQNIEGREGDFMKARDPQASSPTAVKYSTTVVDGLSVAYREAGDPQNP